MKKTILLIPTLILLSCSSDKVDVTEKKEEVIKAPVDSSKIWLASQIKDWKDHVNEIPELLKKFDFKEDKIEGGGWYEHKKKKNKFKTHIEAPVCVNGYFYLKTNYCGDDWIFHDRIIVKIGKDSYESNHLESFSEYNVHNNNSGSVFESLHLTSPLQDAYIIIAIATSRDKEITIRFKGAQNEKDIKLSDEDKQIIRDCYDLSQFLTVSKNGSVENIILDEKWPEVFYLVPTGNHPTTEIKKTN